ncbi:MAG: hypothetical protein WD688_06655, partial [Candidatus Binatia bacterium]
PSTDDKVVLSYRDELSSPTMALIGFNKITVLKVVERVSICQWHAQMVAVFVTAVRMIGAAMGRQSFRDDRLRSIRYVDKPANFRYYFCKVRLKKWLLLNLSIKIRYP